MQGGPGGRGGGGEGRLAGAAIFMGPSLGMVIINTKTSATTNTENKVE